MDQKQSHGSAFTATVFTSLSGTATINGATGKIHYITAFSASSEAATAVVTVLCGSAVLWQDRIGNAGAYVVNIRSPLYQSGVTGQGSAVTINVTGGSILRANILGYSL